MVAPTGVNEELPGEPAKAGTPGAGTAEAEPSQAEGAQGKAAPAAVVPAEAVPPQAEPAEDEGSAAGPADVTAAGAEAEPAGVESVEAELAIAEPVEAEPVEVEAEPDVEGPAEAGAAEADWDAEEGRRDVSPLAVVGIIFGVIALVGVAVGVLAVVTHGFRPKTVVTYRPAAAFGLRPGQCVNSGSDALKVTVVSCASQHDAEVFAAFTLPAGPWPGSSAVRVDAGDGCASRLDSYIDPQLATASLTQAYIYPNQGAWQAGERRVVCEVSAVNGRLTGSVRAQV
jgi:putative regulator of septum formation